MKMGQNQTSFRRLWVKTTESFLWRRVTCWMISTRNKPAKWKSFPWRHILIKTNNCCCCCCSFTVKSSAWIYSWRFWCYYENIVSMATVVMRFYKRTMNSWRQGGFSSALPVSFGASAAGGGARPRTLSTCQWRLVTDRSAMSLFQVRQRHWLL